MVQRGKGYGFIQPENGGKGVFVHIQSSDAFGSWPWSSAESGCCGRGGHDASKPAPRVPSSRLVGIAPARSRLVRSQRGRFHRHVWSNAGRDYSCADVTGATGDPHHRWPACRRRRTELVRHADASASRWSPICHLRRAEQLHRQSRRSFGGFAARPRQSGESGGSSRTRCGWRAEPACLHVELLADNRRAWFREAIPAGQVLWSRASECKGRTQTYACGIIGNHWWNASPVRPAEESTVADRDPHASQQKSEIVEESSRIYRSHRRAQFVRGRAHRGQHVTCSIWEHHSCGIKRQLLRRGRIEVEYLELRMGGDEPLRVAIERAWTVHLATHNDVDAADARRCSLERYLRGNGRLVKVIRKNWYPTAFPI